MAVAAVGRAAWAANGGATVANFLELYKRACCQATPAGFRILRERLAFKGRRRAATTATGTTATAPSV